MKKIALLAALWVGCVTVALAGPIKHWYPGEVVLPADLNRNFAHLANNIVAGDGGFADIRNTLVDRDFARSAALLTGKLRYPAHIPKAWAYVAGGCTTACAGTCTFSGVNISNVCNAALGTHTITLNYTASSTTYPVLTTLIGAGRGACQVNATTATTITVVCLDFTIAAPYTSNEFGYYVQIFDSSNIGGIP